MKNYNLVGYKYFAGKQGNPILTLSVVSDFDDKTHQNCKLVCGKDVDSVPFFGDNAEQALKVLSSVKGGLDNACKEGLKININGFFKDYHLIGCAVSL